MARLLILAAFFAGSLATYSGSSSYGGGGYGGGGYGGGGWDSSNKKQEKGGNDKVIEIDIHVISWGHGGSAPTQDVAAPKMPPGQTHTVVVGGIDGRKVYTPETIVAEIGDVVQFNFMSKNHTVTQSTFPLPCVKLADGKDSGFLPNPDNGINPPPSFIFQVLTKKPIWFYCRQKGHCGSGMTFSINPTADKSQALFKQMAIEQNGTASGLPPTASPPYPLSSVVVTTAAATAPAVTPPPPPPASTSLPVIAPPPPVNNNGGAPPSSNVQGSGNGGSGACECSCFCGVAAFPAGVGAGSWGGLPGAVPAS